MSNINQELIKIVERDYSKIAGEPVKAEYIKGFFYLYGSEIATLRLFRKMPRNIKGDTNQGWSENLKTFYFSFESSFGENDV